jgi:hypothetical protein
MRIRPTVKETRRLKALVDSFEAACIERQGKIEALERDNASLREQNTVLKLKQPKAAPSPPEVTTVVDYSRADTDLLIDFAVATLSGDHDQADVLESQLEKTATFKPHPQQQIADDGKGVLRFRKNNVVDRLVNEIPGGHNYVMTFDAPREDFAQLAQLIGYSVSGYQSLSYALPVQGYDE